MSAQLPLALRWPANQCFECFVVGANAATLALVEELAAGRGDSTLFIAGPAGSGRTHLLVAACVAAGAQAQRAQYIDLAVQPAATIRAFHGTDLLAVDNVDAIAGNGEAEHALFDLHNRARADGTRLLAAASLAPGRLGLALPDLVSRLSAFTQAGLVALDEPTRREVLRAEAGRRGIGLDEAVIDWLFAHHARDLASLMRLLAKIDEATLASRRRVTVPFLRDLLDTG
ncbi:MAG: DnaA regulatory inactivator Hda [Xanthomonadales bacterium]|nr:DnaA regulatory inactivator Hda [Xanthomonadales bacterium]